MVYRGIVKGGVIVIEGNPSLPEGALVSIQPIEAEEFQTLGQRLMKYAGTVGGLPPDLAENHDHYLYGTL